MKRFIIGAILLCLTGTANARQLEVLTKKSCELPSELKGTSGHVLMRYRINDLGKVNFVEPVFDLVDPADRKDALLASIEGCLRTWTYRVGKQAEPHRASGQPRGYLELLLGFHYFVPAPSDAERVTLPDGRQVPKAHLEEMRQVKLKFAERVLAGSAFHEVSRPGWTLKTNVPRKDHEAMLGAIESAMERFDQVFAKAPPLPESSRMVALLFRTEDEFNQVAAFDNVFSAPKLGGKYSREEQIVYTFAQSQEHPLRLSLDYLVHEVTHHLVHQRLAVGDRRPPKWVDEGIATYVEFLEPPRKGTLDRFKFRRGRQAQGSYRWIEKSDGYIEAFLRHDKAGSLPDIDRFLSDEIGKMDLDLGYGLSWILVHYFINGEGGAHFGPFQKWLVESMGASGDLGITEAVGRTPGQIMDALRRHVAAMKHSG